MKAREWLRKHSNELVRVFRWVDNAWKEIEPAEVEEDDLVYDEENEVMENLLFLE